MTSKQFFDYAQKNGCEVTPIEGINITGMQIRFINKKNRNLYTHLSLPLNDKDLPSFAIERMCINLGIPLPPGF